VGEAGPLHPRLYTLGCVSLCRGQISVIDYTKIALSALYIDVCIRLSEAMCYSEVHNHWTLHFSVFVLQYYQNSFPCNLLGRPER